jgi:hypothetical protein
MEIILFSHNVHEQQILNIDHCFLVAAVICQQIDDHDQLRHLALYDDDDNVELAPAQPDEPHVSVWAK